MSTSKVVGSRGKVSEDFQPVAAVDGMLQVKRTGEVGVAQSGSVLAMEKMMHTTTPDGDISSRQVEQAEIDPILRQVLRLRGGGGNGEKDLDSIIGELRNFVGALIESLRDDPESQATVDNLRTFEKIERIANERFLENLQNVVNIRSLEEFAFEPKFIAATACEQLQVIVSKVSGEPPYFPRAGLRNVGTILAMLNEEPVASALGRFRGEFLPKIRGDGPVPLPQFEAEKRNLGHMLLCADEMLTDVEHGGLGFNPEFVARMVHTRLEIVMFGSVEGQIRAPGGQHQPASMFDFGPERASVTLQPFREQVPPKGPGGVPKAVDHTYPTTGRAASPDADPSAQPPVPAHRGAPFSFLRGCPSPSAADRLGLFYTPPNGRRTTCLPERFRQFLQARALDERWDFGPDTPLMELPPAMMFLVGLQFGQINVGTWNPFTLAAKRYFALQSCNSQVDIESKFFWQDGTAPRFADPLDHNALLLEAFRPLLENAELRLPLNPAMAAQFEIALCSYYAMNMEILSRVSFDGNDPANCRMAQVFRLEGLEALEPMGMVRTADEGTTYAATDESGQPLGVPALSRRSVIDSSSATMFVRSVDKVPFFPPPIKVVTVYRNVSHARVFGSHLFNVDFSTANRVLPDALLGKLKHTEYEEGCPFFKDPQREFLLMSCGLRAEVDGVIALAPDENHCFVLNARNKGVATGAFNFDEGVQGLPKRDHSKIRAQYVFFISSGDTPVEDLLRVYKTAASSYDNPEGKKKLAHYRRQLQAITAEWGLSHICKV